MYGTDGFEKDSARVAPSQHEATHNLEGFDYYAQSPTKYFPCRKIKDSEERIEAWLRWLVHFLLINGTPVFDQSFMNYPKVMHVLAVYTQKYPLSRWSTTF